MEDSLFQKIKHLLIEEDQTISDALKQMDAIDKKLLIVVKSDNSYKSLVSIGDIQRDLIKNQNFSVTVASILRPTIKVASLDSPIVKIKKEMLAFRMEFMPVLDENNQLSEVVLWEDVFSEKHSYTVGTLNLPVIIMAGGKGSRLKPISNVIPKPLIPLGEKTIIEHIMFNFSSSGATTFYVSVNYKASMIKEYLKDSTLNIQFFEEDKPLGTAGSLSIIKNVISGPFFVTNCDILVQENYEEIYKYHQNNKNELTLVAAIKNYEIPYGTLEITKDGVLDSLTEKPTYNFFVNAGMYILEPHLLEEIPDNTFYHITHLIEKIISRGGRVGVFPVKEGDWLDVGNWKEYNSSLAKLGEQPFFLQ